MEWSIQEIAKLAGTTSRTLRHYDEIGLLQPLRIGANGYRYYGEVELRTLQRIMLLRDLGMALDAIGRVIASDLEEREALAMHLTLLTEQHHRIAQQIAGVQHTLQALEGKEELMAETMFEGFDHAEYRDEVEQRWGAKAAAASEAWWSGLSDANRHSWQAQVETLNADWRAAFEAGEKPSGTVGQALAQRHVAWLRSVPGTPMQSAGAAKSYIEGLGELYVCDERFAANYGGAEGAAFVRDALAEHVRGGLA